MASSTYRRWVRPEVYPLLVPMAGVLGLMVYQLVRNITTNPDVRVDKEKRAAGILENFEEGQRYKENPVRRYIRTQPREVMSRLNSFFADPK